MCFTLGSSIAEIVSAFPTAGGLYVHQHRSPLRSGHTLDPITSPTFVMDLSMPDGPECPICNEGRHFLASARILCTASQISS